MKAKRKKAAVYAIVALTCIALFGLTAYLKSVADYKHAVKAISFEKINIADVSDGVYIGECDVNFIYARVEVTVNHGEITAITILEHKNERGKSAEPMMNEIVERQEVDVDAISGATNSSVVLKKAVENALKKGY